MNNKSIAEIKDSFARLYEIISHLRSPSGCPWDREQSPSTIRENLLEEAYECIQAIEEKNNKNFMEELGDLFLILVMFARMSEEMNAFSLKDVLDGICEKLIRRHPHVFQKKEDKSVQKIIEHWDYIKEHIEGKKHKQSILENISPALPPLEKAYQIQKKVSKVGFDWKNPQPVWNKIKEEIEEAESASRQKNGEELELEIGDLFFSIVNFSRLAGINPGLALERSNRKFISRFQRIEDKLKEMNIRVEDAGFQLLDNLWDQVKKS